MAPGSCNLLVTPTEVECGSFFNEGNPPRKPAEVPQKKEKEDFSFSFKDVPPEKVEAMKKYAFHLRKKFPHMKKERLGRKIAEFFKVKLV